MKRPSLRDAGTPPSATLLGRAALALYPPAWRARYGDEVHALLDESGGGLGAVASVAWRALPAWIWPPGHLHDRPARMRASLSTGLMAWSFLTGLGLVFAQLTQFQGFRPAGHPVIHVSYLVFDTALALSVAAAGLGGLPLWLLMLRRAHRERLPGAGRRRRGGHRGQRRPRDPRRPEFPFRSLNHLTSPCVFIVRETR